MRNLCPQIVSGDDAFKTKYKNENKKYHVRSVGIYTDGILLGS